MAKMSIDFEGFNEILKKMNQAEANVKEVAEETLKKGFEIMTSKAEAAPYPAGGRYATGRMEKSLLKTPKITWSGTEASVDVGFNLKHGGLPWVFMAYGTPRYMKIQAMYDAFYGSQTEGEVINAAKEIFYKAMGELE